MFASMYAADGAGLAANQIGVGLSIFVFDCADESGRKHVGHVINPTSVVADGGPRTDPEGCLSVPHLFFDAERQAHAVVEGVDLHGEPVRCRVTATSPGACSTRRITCVVGSSSTGSPATNASRRYVRSAAPTGRTEPVGFSQRDMRMAK